MKRIAVFIILMFLVICTSCGKNLVSQNSRKSIVVTSFYQYDFVKNILGDNFSNFDVVLLNKNGVDINRFTPNALDIIDISTATIFIYTGGESEKWAEDYLANMDSKPREVLKLSDYVTVKNVEIIEGMDISDKQYDGEAIEQSEEINDYIWLSIKNAEKMVNAITEVISSVDKVDLAIYEKNADDFLYELSKLDDLFIETTNLANTNTIVVADKFLYRYLVNDYSILYYAALDCYSNKGKVSDETINFLANKVDTLDLKHLIVNENSTEIIANEIKNKTVENQDILVLNSMQNITAQDIEKNISYLEIMENNLETLKLALN